MSNIPEKLRLEIENETIVIYATSDIRYADGFQRGTLRGAELALSYMANQNLEPSDDLVKEMVDNMWKICGSSLDYIELAQACAAIAQSHIQKAREESNFGFMEWAGLNGYKYKTNGVSDIRMWFRPYPHDKKGITTAELYTLYLNYLESLKTK